MVKSRPLSDRSVEEIHVAWRQWFISQPGWNEAAGLIFRRREGVPDYQRCIKAFNKLESQLRVLYKKHEAKMNFSLFSPLQKSYPIGNAFSDLLEAIEMDRGLIRAIHESRTPSSTRVVPAFAARLILVGFVIHGKSLHGRKLMKMFLDKNNPSDQCFYQWFKRKFTWKKPDGNVEFELEEVANAICSGRGAQTVLTRAGKQNLSQWTKQQKSYFLDAVEFAGERKAPKRNSLKRAEIMTTIQRRADELLLEI